jgi:hypothetical protein
MTNLLILYPDIPAAARKYKTYTDDTAETPNETESFLHNCLHRNTLRGERYQYWRSAYTTDEHNAVYDLGTTDAVANTKSANFLVLSRADYLESADIEINLQNSSDDVTYTTVASIVNDGSVSKVGPWGNDYVSTFADTTARRYWRANYVDTAAAAFQLRASKIYFGTAFDFGVDPSVYSINRIDKGDISFTTSGGCKYLGRVSHPTYQIEM